MNPPLHSEPFFAGGGEQGARMRAFDWTKSPLGLPHTWPQSLASALSICLSSPYPIAIYWGPSLALLYNDAWAPILGRKHPNALGQAAAAVWPEIWEIIAPQLQAVIASGETTRQQDGMLPMDRHGFVEECYFDYCFSPIRGEGGRIEGVFNAVVETSYRLIGERQTRTLNVIADRLLAATEPETVARTALAALGEHPHDTPWAVALELAPATCLTISGTMGLTAGDADLLAVGRSLPADAGLLPAVASGQAVDLFTVPPAIARGLPDLPLGRDGAARPVARLLPLALPGQDVGGLLLLGVNPRRAYDDQYRHFLDAIGDRFTQGLARALAVREVRDRAAALAALDRAKTEFFSNVSHEFRTPLTLMLGPMHDLLQGDAGPLQPAQHQLISLMQRNGQRLQRLVNTLLDFSRLEAGRAQASFVATDLGLLTADIASAFRSAIESAALEFIVDCPASPMVVHVDRAMWEQVVSNLLSNALKHTFHGAITVQVQASATGMRLRVVDTGVGIPAAHLPKLFDRFHRVEGMRSRTHEGSGIGLALVQQIIALHGGTLEVSSVVDCGSTFQVNIPAGTAHLPADQLVGVAPGHAPLATSREAIRESLGLGETKAEDAAAAEQSAVVHDDGRELVVVADDNADMRAYLGGLMASRWQVVTVADGQQALAVIRTRKPDLILTDSMMPNLDGLGLLRAIREDPAWRDIPVVLLSARAGEEASNEGLNAGADDYLTKPFTATELLARVAAHLRLRCLRQEAMQVVRASEERFRTVAEELQTSQEQLQLALSSARMAAWVWHPTINRVQFTGNAAEILGLRSTSDLATCEEGLALFHPDDRAPHAAIISQALAQVTSYCSTYRFIRPVDGRTVWIEEHGTAQALGDLPRWLCGVSIDITERKLAEEKLLGQAEDLRQVNAELEHFAAIASHDLQEPLRMVTSFADLLVRRYGDALDERAQGYLLNIQRGTGRMRDLIHALLTYGQVGKKALHHEPISTTEIIAEVIEDLQVRSAGRPPVITIKDLPIIRADRVRMTQLFRNLVSNALKFVPPERTPEITITGARVGEEWQLSVADNGIGIPPSAHERIFRIFQRLHLQTEYPGSGIGLATCKRIVQMHQGRIWVASSEGLGATFTVAIPCAPAVA